MLPSIFVMRLRKPADDFFKNIPHLQIGDYAWMEILLILMKYNGYSNECVYCQIEGYHKNPYR